MMLPLTPPAPTTAYRRHPQAVLAAVESGLRELGLDHLYTHAYPAIGVISVAPGVTAAWCDGHRLTCHLVLTDPGDVTPYEHLYTGLRAASLPQGDSLGLLTKAATELPED